MRPWLIMMRTISGITCYILADDVLIIATGRRMIGQLAEALNKTHEYLNCMGARVAPSKSYNCASTVKAADWFAKTVWVHLGTTIEVIEDFRYLGAHLTTRWTPTSRAMDDRWTKAHVQLKKLRSCPATAEAMANIILVKTYAAGWC